MTITTAAILKERFKQGEVPTGQDFIDLIDSFLLADQSNFPNPLPAVGAQNLLNVPVPTGATIEVAEFNEIVQVPSYLSSKSFLVSGNLVSQFPPNRRLYLTLTPAPMTTQVDTSSYNVSQDNTTVTIIDAMPNTTLSKVAVATVNPLAAFGSVSQQTAGFTRGADLAAAATLDTGTLHYSFDVTGTTGISAIAQRPAGTFIRLKFAGAVTLTHGSSLQLIGGVDYTTNPGDTLEFEAQSLGWRQVGVLIDPDLYAIANLSGTAGLPRKIAANSWELDNSRIGVWFHHSAATPPSGALERNGAAILVASYAALATVLYCGDANNATAAWGYRCSNSDGSGRSTTGNYIVLPDGRGEFDRGWDHGRGKDSGRSLWGTQADELKSHYHGYYFNGGGSVTWHALVYTNTGDLVSQGAILPAGGAETRPTNIAGLPCLWYR